MPAERITLSTINLKLDSVISKLDKHDLLLQGTESTPGFLTRVDRLEQSEQRRVWHIRALWGATLGLISHVLGNWWR